MHCPRNVADHPKGVSVHHIPDMIRQSDELSGSNSSSVRCYCRPQSCMPTGVYMVIRNIFGDSEEQGEASVPVRFDLGRKFRWGNLLDTILQGFSIISSLVNMRISSHESQYKTASNATCSTECLEHHFNPYRSK